MKDFTEALTELLGEVTAGEVYFMLTDAGDFRVSVRGKVGKESCSATHIVDGYRLSRSSVGPDPVLLGTLYGLRERLRLFKENRS
jgi:hypothetical protein